LDWALAIALVIFAIRGAVRGSIRQVFGLGGVLLGLWGAGWMSQWVGAHWQGARPAVLFVVMGWLVAGLAGLAIASVLEWGGNALAEAAKAGSLGWVDRLLGALVGALLGAVVAALVVLLMTLTPWPRDPRAWAEASRGAALLVRGGAAVSGWTAPVLPRGTWLRGRFLEAAHRIGRHPDAS
jgi:uncharacterized membrane protein required for colicin V production